jgi:hypothetical protein
METMRKRLTAVRAATAAIRPALARFYETLDQGQKVRFAGMSRGVRNASLAGLARQSIVEKTQPRQLCRQPAESPGRRLLGRRQVCRSRPERTSWNRLARDGVSIN